jgi:hypothetical protein
MVVKRVTTDIVDSVLLGDCFAQRLLAFGRAILVLTLLR